MEVSASSISSTNHVIFFCRVNITSSALFGFAWYCQMAFDPGSIKVLLMTTTNTHNVQKMVRLVGIFYEILNLDFFRSLARGICLYGVDTLVVLVSNLVVGFYPLLLMVLTYFVIKLHSNVCRLFVFIWRPFGRILRATGIDTNFSSKTSLIDAFVTFFLLTNVKFISISFSLLVPVKILSLNAKACRNDTLRLFSDATVPYFGSRHLPYAILAVSVLTVFVLMPTLMGGFRGVSGVSGNPLVSQVVPHLLFTAKRLWPHVYPMWLSASLSMDSNSCRPPDPVQTQLSSFPVQKADAEPPEKERQIQVTAQRPVLDALLYTSGADLGF